MGTSQSSRGPSGNVPMVPPWVPDPAPAVPAAPPPDGNTAAPDGDGNNPTPPAQTQPAPQQPAPAPVPPIPMAPPKRFLRARRRLGRFAQSGDAGDMRRGVGSYIRNGYGGGGTAVRRFGGTVSTANTLYGALSATASGQAVPGTPLDPAILAGQSAQAIMDAVVEAVRPADGTQDAEAGRAAIKDALSDLLTAFPQADLINLSEEQRTFAVERFVAVDVYRRIELDIGKIVQDNAPSAGTALSRLKEIRNYVKETVAAAFRKLRDTGKKLTKGRVNEIVRAALTETFEVFESYR